MAGIRRGVEHLPDAGSCLGGEPCRVELHALIFATDTIIPERILPTLPNVVFELKPEEPKPPMDVESNERKPAAVGDPLS